MALINDVTANIIADASLFLLGGATRHVAGIFWKMLKNRKVSDFFGLYSNRVVICHTAIQADPHRIDVPLADIRVAEILATFIQKNSVLTNFEVIIIPHTRLLHENLDEIRDEYMNYPLILVGGPKHNAATRLFLSKAQNLKYDMGFSQNGSHCIKERSSNKEPLCSVAGKDYGLIVSMKDPQNTSRQVTVLAGIHGIGTIGLAKLISSDKQQFSRLCESRSNDVIERIVKIEYSGRIDDLNPTHYQLHSW